MTFYLPEKRMIILYKPLKLHQRHWGLAITNKPGPQNQGAIGQHSEWRNRFTRLRRWVKSITAAKPTP